MCLCTCSVHCTRTLLHTVFVYMNMYVVYTCIYMHVPTHMHAHTCTHTHTHTHTILMQAGLLESVVSSEFVSLVRLIERFVHDCTEVTGRQCPMLRSSLLSQVSMYMNMYMCMCMYIHVRIYMYMQLYIMSQKPQHIYPTVTLALP